MTGITYYRRNENNEKNSNQHYVATAGGYTALSGTPSKLWVALNPNNWKGVGPQGKKD